VEEDTPTKVIIFVGFSLRVCSRYDVYEINITSEFKKDFVKDQNYMNNPKIKEMIMIKKKIN
jgi:hypothetical protein